MYCTWKYGGWLATLWIPIWTEFATSVHKEGHCCVNDSHGDCTQWRKAFISTKNTFPLLTRSLKRQKHSVTTSTIRCLLFRNQSRAAKWTDNQAGLPSKTAGSQSHPAIRGRDIHGFITPCNQGYVNSQDLLHDLPSLFLSCKPFWRDKPCM